MIRSAAEVIQIKYDDLASGNRNVTARGKAAYPVVNRWRSCGVVDINELICCEIGIKSDTE